MNPLQRRRRGFDWPAPRRSRRSVRVWRLFGWVATLGLLAVFAARSDVPQLADDPEAVIAGDARANDGDTLSIRNHRIRLYGIDAVELGQKCAAGGRETACGEKAKAVLAELIDGANVRCEKEANDRYGRVVARCAADGRDLGEAMVAGGWALAYRRHAQDYVAAEEAARAAQRGLWATDFTPPDAWRDRNPRP